jgi:hypothetical protein
MVSPIRQSAACEFAVGKISVSSDVIRVGKFLVICAVITAAADKILSVQVGGFNIRLTQLLSISAFSLTLLISANTGRLKLAPAIHLLAVWYVLNIVFLPNSIVLIRGVLYVGWLGISIMMVLGATNFFKSRADADTLLRWYIRGFSIHALLGLIQFAAYYGAGIELFDMLQIGRIDGFTHEPSHFAAQQLIGYVLIRELSIDRRTLFLPWEYWGHLLLITLSLVLSTSKTAYLFIAVYEGARFLSTFVRVMRFRRVKVTQLASAIGVLVVFFALAATIMANLRNPVVISILNGSGLNGTGAHSVTERMQRVNWTIDAAVTHPIIGLSYGGVGSYMTILRDGVVTQNQAQSEEPLLMPAEIMAATGVFGFVIWGAYMLRMLFAYWKASDSRQRHILQAMSAAIVIGMVALTSDFPRGAIWAHLTVWSVLIMSYQGWSELPLEDPVV